MMVRRERKVKMGKKRPNGYWTPEEVDRVFDEMKERLGRVPMQKEFPGGALRAITRGRYDENVRNWNEYLMYRGEELNRKRGYWIPERIDRAYDELNEKLGRVPTYDEFPHGALEIIEKGRYDSEIKTWNQYLEHKGAELNHEHGKWTPEEVDRVFDEMKERLGRVPTMREFGDKFLGAVKVILRNRYDPEISTWNQYLDHRGEKINKPHRKRKNLDILEDLLEDEDE